MTMQLPAYIGNGLEKLKTYLVGGEHCQAVIPIEPSTAVTGTLAATNAAVVADVSINNSVVVSVTGTFNLSVIFEASLDNSNWFPVYLMQQSNRSLYGSANISAATAFTGLVSGWVSFRVRCSAFTSGSAAIRIQRSIATPSKSDQSLASGSSFIGYTKPQQTYKGAAAVKQILSLATDNAQLIRAGAGAVFGAELSNNGTTWCYVKLYDKASAPVVTDSPKLVLGLPPNTARNLHFGDMGLLFNLGIGLRIVKGAAPNDATFPAANQVLAAIQYYG